MKCILLITLFTITLTTFLSSYATAENVITIPHLTGSGKTKLSLYGDWSSDTCNPTIIMSHGLGGNETAFKRYGSSLSNGGYRIAVMGHDEKGKGYLVKLLFARKKEQLLADPQKFTKRFLDLNATLAFSKKDCTPSNIYLIGHSMGAAVTMLEAGATGKLQQFGGKNRFDAYIALSPQGESWIFGHGAWTNVTAPILMITGTDDKEFDKSDYIGRLAAFNGLPSDGRKRLVILKNASHSDIGGRSKKIAPLVSDIVLEFLKQAKSNPLPKTMINNSLILKIQQK